MLKKGRGVIYATHVALSVTIKSILRTAPRSQSSWWASGRFMSLGDLEPGSRSRLTCRARSTTEKAPIRSAPAPPWLTSSAGVCGRRKRRGDNNENLTFTASVTSTARERTRNRGATLGFCKVLWTSWQITGWYFRTATASKPVVCECGEKIIREERLSQRSLMWFYKCRCLTFGRF